MITNWGERISEISAEEMAEDIILEELQRGYHLNGRVLRHALVKVSMGPGTTNNDQEKIIETSQEVDNSNDAESSEMDK